jgi:hypothetical protein
MKYICFISLFLNGILNAQPILTFRMGGCNLALVQQITPEEIIRHDDPMHAGDDERVKLFKQYFNPGSYENYSTFFLPGDWGNVSLEEYQQWQSTISTKKLLLQNVYHLRDAHGAEYLVFQYAMEGPAYTLYQSSEFKLTPSGWKHTNLQKDEVSDCLMKVGVLEINYVQESIKNEQLEMDIRTVPSEHIRTYKEKFDREKIFVQIEKLLTEKGVSKEDRELARTYFLLRDDQAFIESVCIGYGLHDTQLMDAVNQAVGMQIYNFSKNQNE